MVPDLICDSGPDGSESVHHHQGPLHLSPHRRIRMSYSSILNYKPQFETHPTIEVTPPARNSPNYCGYCQQRRRRIAESQLTGSDSQRMDMFDSNPMLERYLDTVGNGVGGGGSGSRNCTCYYMNRQLMQRNGYIHQIRTPRSAPHITFMQ